MVERVAMESGGRIELVIDGVRARMDAAFPGALLGIWSSEPGTIRVVYRTEFLFPDDQRVYGLWREIEADVPVRSLVDEIVHREIGEPLGSLADELWLEAGVMWFRGNRPEWRLYV